MSWLELGRGVFARRHAEWDLPAPHLPVPHPAGPHPAGAHPSEPHSTTSLDLTTALVLGTERALVIDTGGDEVQGAELAVAVRELTALPLVVVLTHGHFDHCFGTAAFPPGPVLAHPGCRAFLERTAATQRAEWAARYRAEGRAERAAALEASTPVLPDPAPRRIELGGRAVLLHPAPPAHTDHDLAIHVPDADVLFAGDLVENGVPDHEDSHPLTWADAVAQLPRAGTVVPGHGDPMTPDQVAAQRRELAEIATLARAVRAGELTPDEADARSPHPGVRWSRDG